jgi:Domain of unknown function (DUF4405)
MSSKIHLIVDTIALVAFLIVFEPLMTGLAIHEWLSLALAGVLIVHILLHWKWVTSVTTRFFKRLSHSSRINYVVNALLFVVFTVVVFSGLMISETVMPFLGFQTRHAQIWRALHTLSADLTLLLVGLHFALHWRWVANAIWRFVFAPIWQLFGRHKLEPSGVTVKGEPKQTTERDGI